MLLSTFFDPVFFTESSDVFGLETARRARRPSVAINSENSFLSDSQMDLVLKSYSPEVSSGKMDSSGSVLVEIAQHGVVDLDVERTNVHLRKQAEELEGMRVQSASRQ